MQVKVVQAWLLKLDKYGVEEWQNTYSLSDFGYNRSVVQTSNGGYLYASFNGIVKADSSGNEEWKNEKYSFYEDAIEHSNGSFYAVGGPSGGQAQLVKFSSNGTFLKRIFYGSNCEDDIFRSISETQDECWLLLVRRVMEINLMTVPLILCIIKIFGF